MSRRFAVAFIVVGGSIACSSSSGGGSTDATANDAAEAANDAVVDAGCPASPASAGDLEGQPCAPIGIECHGYGSFSCPETATCTDAGTWAVSCPLHPFGDETGTITCGCAHPLP